MYYQLIVLLSSGREMLVLQNFFSTNSTDLRDDVSIGSVFWTLGVTIADLQDETGPFRFGNRGTADVTVCMASVLDSAREGMVVPNAKKRA
mmetsp:Transcript_2010/g.3611  ORF Transcript_2010/g.3611 Transcript_2010/m.3611 type:complete len:91 (+) Transcript_2010:494-766(+)